MKKLLLVIGTRPEAIKMAPIGIKLHKDPRFDSRIVLTGQHKEMAREVLKEFRLKYEYDLDLMKTDQSLNDLAGDIFKSLQNVLSDYQPDMVLVQGDTTTTFVGAVTSFYMKVPVGHVEAGLRTLNKNAPFPEEMNRRLVSQIADLHFAPTENNKENLVKEGIPIESIAVTGNTIVDALKIMREKTSNPFSEPFVVITSHRRDNYDQGITNICMSIKDLAMRNFSLRFIFVTHPNPNIREVVINILDNIDNITLLDPQPYADFMKMITYCKMVITDSGGIQEEAYTLGIPLIILRNETERPEVLNSDKVFLVGHDKTKIISSFDKLMELDDSQLIANPVKSVFGKGNASEFILNKIEQYFLNDQKS